MRTIRYVGDRPFFVAMIAGKKRVAFNRHNGFKTDLSDEDCEFIARQPWGRFFDIEATSEDPASQAEQDPDLSSPSTEIDDPEGADEPDQRQLTARGTQRKLRYYVRKSSFPKQLFKKSRAYKRQKENELLGNAAGSEGGA